MVRYISEKQLSIEEFKTPFQAKLSPQNRWVKLSQVVPWDEFASAYMTMMNGGFGRPGVSPRIVLGALIIKHLEKLDDRGVIQAIQENIYMQYFVGLKEFTIDPVFDPSLFVEIRKRVGYELFDTLSTDLIRSASEKKDSKHNKKKKKDDSDEPENKGKMQADAAVADQYITYPTDNGILNESRKKCEKMIDKLYDTDSHSCPDRIVSIYQPHVRPIPRGKIKSQIEFGAKLGVSLDDGYARINTFSWDAYHEAGDLIK